ncbi:MAG: PQQ-binding-like beta-propeller repeat protein [Firmicutes bacterium]|nr:PQQ-binding-like beta-propeller repeat protein [Bacillota bacterium]
MFFRKIKKNFSIVLLAALIICVAASCTERNKTSGENPKNQNLSPVMPVSSDSSPNHAHAEASSWYKFRGNSRNTGLAPYAEGVSDPVLLWKFKGRHEFMSSPSVSSDGNVIIGSHDGCIYTIQPVGKGQALIKTHESVVSSPLVTQKFIAAGSMDGFFYVFEPTGGIIFKSDMEDWICSSPVLTENGNIIISGRKGILRCFSPDGSVLWNTPVGTGDYEIQSSPAVFNDRIFIGSGDGNIYSVKTDGSITGKFETGSPVYASPAVDESGNIYIGNSAGDFFCLDQDLKLKWKFKTGGGITSSAAQDKTGRIIFGCRDNFVYCLNKDGKPVWTFKTGKSIESSPAVDKTGRIYIGSDDCHLYALNADGRLLWKFGTAGPILSSPALTENRIVFGCEDKYVWCLGEKKQKSEEKPEKNRN